MKDQERRSSPTKPKALAADRRQFMRTVAASGTGLALLGERAQGRVAALQTDQPLICRVVDTASQQEVPARVRLMDVDGREVVPLGHPEELMAGAQEGDTRFQSRRFAYVDGRFRLRRSQLPLRFQVIKGYEYVIAEGRIEDHQLRGNEIILPIERWRSLGEEGWYSGDIHIHHIAPRTCRLEMEAEDVNVANILTSDFTNDQQRFEGKVNAHSGSKHLIYVNQEFRNHHLGHMCLLNLKELIKPVKTVQPHHHPLHLRICDQVHAQGGYVSWAHFPSWPGVESPLDVAMERLDGLEILSVLEPRAMPRFMRQVIPEWESNHGLRLWYRYLNCGFRLTATAGTDKMTTFVTVGSNRVYAQMAGEFNYQNWISALKDGRTFITNSPLLSFTVNGQGPGSTVQAGSARTRVLEIHAVADSQLPYHHLEIVCNGEVIAEATPSGDRYHAEIHLEYPLSQSCWLAARAHEDIGGYLEQDLNFSTVHIDQGTLHGNYYGTRRPETVFAHTSPVYVVRDGLPIRSWDDAQYYVRYMDRSLDWVRNEAKFASRGDRVASIEAFLEGKRIYQQRAREALGI